MARAWLQASLAQAAQDPRPEIHKSVRSSRILLQPDPENPRAAAYLIELGKAFGNDDALVP